MKNKLFKLSLLAAFPLLLSACNYNVVYQVTPYPFDLGNSTGGDDVIGDDEIDETKTYDIKVWCDDRIKELTEIQITRFQNENKNIKFNFKVYDVGEDSAAKQMIEDIDTGADIFVFAQDQINKLKTSGALQPIEGSLLNSVKSTNSEASVSAATLGGTCYAFPFTSDNGYFLMYDKTVLSETDVTDFETMLKVCQTKSKKVNFNIYGSGFYSASVFMGAGCKNTWEINSKNKFYNYTDTYNSENGILACKALKMIRNYPIIANSDDPSKFGRSLGACVTGMWNYSYAKEAIGDNLACAPLPNVKVGDEQFHLGSFSGYKLLGIKYQSDTSKINLCKRIGKYLSGEDCQRERFESVEWGPTNKTVSELAAVKAQPGLNALALQSAYAQPQTACPSSWFDAVSALTTSIKVNSTDAEIQAALDQYVANLEEMKE